MGRTWKRTDVRPSEKELWSFKSRFASWSVQWMESHEPEAGKTVVGTDLRVNITVSTIRNSRLQKHPLSEFVYQELIYNHVVIIFFFKKKFSLPTETLKE